jgi:hypothetical protein
MSVVNSLLLVMHASTPDWVVWGLRAAGWVWAFVLVVIAVIVLHDMPAGRALLSAVLTHIVLFLMWLALVMVLLSAIGLSLGGLGGAPRSTVQQSQPVTSGPTQGPVMGPMGPGGGPVGPRGGPFGR